MVQCTFTKEKGKSANEGASEDKELTLPEHAFCPLPCVLEKKISNSTLRYEVVNNQTLTQFLNKMIVK